MNIITLGDLLNISEAELLSYKNFGETSLREIKFLLDTKGLHLGMAMEEQLPSAEISDLSVAEDKDEHHNTGRPFEYQRGRAVIL